ncbi:AzlD domain-containing protein [Pseudogemmobacter sp. W21_MBD1_M6]|uniref:AzlD domain-containing protein n=1 Tax=Pseudogemmobacter sp. W21_MBD1_M6 TaxID=3240271 RepID=UPI003F9B16DE
MTLSSFEIWTIIIAMGIGTFLIRFSFLGMIGNRKLPEWVLRHLRYTPVAIMPGLVAPLVLWPAATDGALDAPRLAAACMTLLVGMLAKNTLAAIFGGAVTLYSLMYLLG